MAMNINRNMDFRHGNSASQDIVSVNNVPEKSDDKTVDQMRKKIGTEFTADPGRHIGKKKNEMGKDDFMKLMSAQLKYQDPISPMKNEEMAAQLAQFSALEQMMNVNNTLEKMVSGQKPSEHMLAASLIGKRVTTDSNHIQYEKGSSPEIKFNLPSDANQVNVAVVDAKGEVVREIEMGEMQKGEQSVRWDGKNGKGQEQPLGEYSFKVTAADKNEKPIVVNSDSSGVVTGITFEGGKSILLVGDKKVAIERVGRIEQDDPKAVKGASAAGAKGANAGEAEAAGGEQPAGAAAAKPLATGAKQNSSSSEGAAGTSPQVAKNNLPADLTPEKINSMLQSMGAVPTKGPVAATEQSGAMDEKTVDPLWNPATN